MISHSSYLQGTRGTDIFAKVVEQKSEHGRRTFMYCQDEAFSRKSAMKKMCSSIVNGSAKGNRTYFCCSIRTDFCSKRDGIVRIFWSIIYKNDKLAP